MKKYFCLLLLLHLQAFAQPGSVPNLNLVYSEFHVIRSGELNQGFLFYKVPYDRLVFHKNDDLFSAGLKIGLEVSEESSGTVYRTFKEESISVADFELTNSRSSYLQGLLKFDLEKGRYNILPLFSDANSNREFKSRAFSFNSDSTKKYFGNPVIINSGKKACDGAELFTLANFSGQIPFSSQNYSILIPILDSTIQNAEIEIIQDRNSVYKKNIDELLQLSLNFSFCENMIVINPENQDKTKRFILLDDISSLLHEGVTAIQVRAVSDTLKEERFNVPVRWIDKPRSLNDLEKSIEYLSVIEDEDSVSLLKKASRENLPHKFFEFWKKYDPTPGTVFNELMNEFYLRVDYADMNFRTLNGNNGARSDRGRIYIQYGQPDELDRFTDENGRMLETWKYTNPSRTFIFIDKRGNGNFTMVNSQ